MASHSGGDECLAARRGGVSPASPATPALADSSDDETQPPATLEGKPIPDLDQSEKVAMLILAVATILFGIFPFLALDMMDAYTQTIFAALFGGA